jgi:hypothetical protein
VGDFTATKVDGKVQKNGGNVAGYFCTPEGFVLNAVVGPVPAQKLLSEARWAVEVEDQLHGGKRDWRHDAQLVAAAHQAQAGDRVHALLAQLPLEPVPKVQAAVFTGLGNEKIADNRYDVLTAAAGLEKANKQGLPILFVFYADAKAPSNAALDRLVPSSLRGPVRNCVVIALPINQLAALSSLTHLPAYELAERTMPTMVLADSQAREIAPIRRDTPPDELASRLWTAITAQRFDHAQRLLEENQPQAAKLILGLIASAPFDSPVKAVARRQWLDLKAGKTVQAERSSAKSVASAGSRP